MTAVPTAAPTAPPIALPTTAPAGTRCDEIAELDRAVYRAVAETPSPLLDRPMRRLSSSADHSLLWLAIAVLFALLGGWTGRRAAAAGVLAIGVDSAAVNLGMKLIARRRRPDPVGSGVPAGRWVHMPGSGSFPSGHAAAGFAFADAVASGLPAAGAPLRLLAAAVAYSRVHTGVHYPSDVIAGALVGSSLGRTVGAAVVAHAGRTKAGS